MGRSSLAALALALLMVSACVDATLPESSRRGRYVLARINGDALPALVAVTPVAELYFVSGTLMLNDDESFSDITAMRRNPKPSGSPQFPADTTRGTYQFAGDTVLLTMAGSGPPEARTYRMTFQASGSLVQHLVGNTLTYRR